MKKGFTLIELLVVIVIIGVASASSIVSFSNIDKTTKDKEKKNLYAQVQRSALLYLDLKDNYLEQFTEDTFITISYSDLKNLNYISSDIDSKIKDNNKDKYLIKIFISKDSIDNNIINFEEDNIYVNTSIIYYNSNNNNKYCVADHNGNYKFYEDYIPYGTSGKENYINKLIRECNSLEDSQSIENEHIERYKNCNCYVNNN